MKSARLGRVSILLIALRPYVFQTFHRLVHIWSIKLEIGLRQIAVCVVSMLTHVWALSRFDLLAL